MRWFWQRRQHEVEQHTARVDSRDHAVNVIYRTAKRQKEENHIGDLLGSIFITTPKERHR